MTSRLVGMSSTISMSAGVWDTAASPCTGLIPPLTPDIALMGHGGKDFRAPPASPLPTQGEPADCCVALRSPRPARRKPLPLLDRKPPSSARSMASRIPFRTASAIGCPAGSRDRPPGQHLWSGSGRVPQSHSMLFEAPGQQSRLRNRHKPDEAPWIDPDQAVRPRMLEDPFPECLFPEFLLQVSIGQHVHRKYIEDMLMTMPLRR